MKTSQIDKEVAFLHMPQNINFKINPFIYKLKGKPIKDHFKLYGVILFKSSVTYKY